MPLPGQLILALCLPLLLGLSQSSHQDRAALRLPQIMTLQLDGSASSEPTYGLHQTETNLLGAFGVTAINVIDTYAPHLTGIEIRSHSLVTTGDHTVHETYHLYWAGFRIEAAEIRLHTYRNRLVFLRLELPEFHLSQSQPTARDFIPLKDLGYDPTDPTYTHDLERVIVESSNFPTPAWLWQRTENATGTGERRLIDAQTGALLYEETYSFHLAQAYSSNPKSSPLEKVSLADLYPSGYLEGPHFSVTAKDASRIYAKDGDFTFDPNQDPVAFDQVQAYFFASETLKHFSDKYGYSLNGMQVQVQTNDVIFGSGDNAYYVPPPRGPMIRIGRGEGSITGLARDSDVLTHEFAHHIIFERIKITSGESGQLHEGYADYLAYAKSNDPYLAESIWQDHGYLRTAQLDEDQGEFIRADDPTKDDSRYFRAQIWTALLWDLREALGQGFDQTLYHSFNYLGATAGYREAMLGLLNADRDLNPLAEDNPEFQVYGANKCTILSFATSRGYAQYTEELDGSSCGMDLELLGEKSRAFADAKNNPDVETKPFMPFKCSVVTGVTPAAQKLFFWVLALPLMVLWRRKHGY